MAPGAAGRPPGTPASGAPLARVVYSPRALADLERLADFVSAEPDVAHRVLALITEAVEMLERHPFLGRPAEAGLRELVISHGRTGYVALYAIERRRDAVAVLAIRHQREAGY